MSASSGAAQEPIAGRALPAGARRRRGGLSWSVRALLALAAVIGIAAIFAVWADRQLLDTREWTSRSSKLLADDAIQRELSGYLTNQIYANVDVARELRAVLPGPLGSLSEDAARGLHTLTGKAIVRSLSTPQIQQLWRIANEAAHRQLVRQIERQPSPSGHTPQDEALVLDLRPIVVALAERIGVPSRAAEQLRSDVGEIVLARSQRLETLKGAARGLHDLAYVLPILAVLLLALAVALSRGRRRRAIVGVGLAAALAGGASLIIRALVGSQVVDELATSEAVRPAANAAWSIATSLLDELALATILAGGALVVLALLSSLLRTRRRRARGA
ncbi:MAG TPA: hypothetical protein VH081_02590 [Solirubrobacteraceae bacterium]|nr:hypothetical protein [Solirubrobacteraceae bacterium]